MGSYIQLVSIIGLKILKYIQGNYGSYQQIIMLKIKNLQMSYMMIYCSNLLFSYCSDDFIQPFIFHSAWSTAYIRVGFLAVDGAGVSKFRGRNFHKIGYVRGGIKILKKWRRGGSGCEVLCPYFLYIPISVYSSARMDWKAINCVKALGISGIYSIFELSIFRFLLIIP